VRESKTDARTGVTTTDRLASVKSIEDLVHLIVSDAT
jgi:hypothetical protein